MQITRFSSLVRMTCVAAAALTLLAPVSAAQAGADSPGAAASTSAVPSVAGTTNCGSSVGIDWYAVARVHPPVAGRVVQLLTGHLTDKDHALLLGSRSGDRVWIDKRPVGASRWTQCGPFNARESRALSNHPDTQTRACFDYRVAGGRAAYCTDWYTGHDD